MKKSDFRQLQWASSPQDGFSLVEMLVASAIITVIITLITPLMLTMVRERNTLQTSTDRVESVRQVASIATQDARYAKACAQDYRWVQDLETGEMIWEQYLRLTRWTDAAGVHVVDYMFADSANVVDYENLHRLQGTIPPGVEDPIWDRDDIVGRNLVWSEEPSGYGTSVGCESRSTNKNVSLHLVTLLDKKSPATEASFDVFAYLRPN